MKDIKLISDILNHKIYKLKFRKLISSNNEIDNNNRKKTY